VVRFFVYIVWPSVLIWNNPQTTPVANDPKAVKNICVEENLNLPAFDPG